MELLNLIGSVYHRSSLRFNIQVLKIRASHPRVFIRHSGARGLASGIPDRIIMPNHGGKFS